MRSTEGCFKRRNDHSCTVWPEGAKPYHSSLASTSAKERD
jgi:hypothetical protein